MAKMRPAELPEDVRKEPFRASEITFFDAARQLPDNWFVLYGVTWYLRARNNSWSEGEADFVIVSPDTGLVVIEVKGGRIGRDSNGWYSIDRHDEKHRIKDPALQAANCKHNILRYIKTSRAFASRDIPARHMVCFPNVSEKDAPILIELPREMQILSEDFCCLADRIVSFALRDYSSPGSTNRRLTPRECSEIVDVLKPNFDCPNRWSTQAAKQNAIMAQLTDDQAYLWDIIEGNDRVSLSGPAGSGKTILALKLIKRHVENGEPVLALLPSVPLMQYYSASINNSNLHVACYRVTDESPIDLNDYSLVVIDEAQDIAEDTWLNLYEIYNIESAGKFLCLFDSNQKLRPNGLACPVEKLVPLRLSKVLRNTKQIGDFSAQFFSGDKSISIIGPSGTKVQYTNLPYSDLPQRDVLSDIVIDLIRHYVFDEGFDYSDIVVLFADNRCSLVKKNGNEGNDLGISFRAARTYMTSYAHKDPFVICENVQQYRGLESNVVILTGIDNIKSDLRDNACYIGASRARNVLHIIASTQTIRRIQNQ